MAFSKKPRSNRMDPVRIRRESEALRLRERGKSYTEIGRIMGLNKGTAHDLVQGALVHMNIELTESVLKLELLRLDVAVAEVMEMIESSVTQPRQKLEAIDRLIKLQDRRAKYLQLDSPVRIELPTEVQDDVAPLLQSAEGALLVAQVEAFVAGNAPQK